MKRILLILLCLPLLFTTCKKEEEEPTNTGSNGLTYVPDDVFEQYLIDEGYLGRVFVLSTNINMKHETDFIIPLDYWMARLGYTVKYGGLDIELPYSNDYVEFLKKNWQ